MKSDVRVIRNIWGLFYCHLPAGFCFQCGRFIPTVTEMCMPVRLPCPFSIHISYDSCISLSDCLGLCGSSLDRSFPAYACQFYLSVVSGFLFASGLAHLTFYLIYIYFPERPDHTHKSVSQEWILFYFVWADPSLGVFESASLMVFWFPFCTHVCYLAS